MEPPFRDRMALPATRDPNRWISYRARIRAALDGWCRGVVGRLLMAAILFGAVESAIADSCDGDARGTATVTAERGSGGAPSAPSVPQHTAHVCHCVHAHGSLPAASETLVALPFGESGAVLPTADRVPAGPSLEPRLRPPLSATA